MKLSEFRSQILPGGRPGGYQLIYADPPWSYRDKANAGKRGASHKYSCMTVPEISALPISEIAAPDCLLAMWWVAPMPLEALRVMDAWGFSLKTVKGITWHKLTKYGKDHIGMGKWTRANTEDCLFAVRGKPKRVDCGVRQFLEAKIGRHSEKPAEARERLVRLLGPVPRIELFARARVSGWDAWGLEAKESASPKETITFAQRPLYDGLGVGNKTAWEGPLP